MGRTRSKTGGAQQDKMPPECQWSWQVSKEQNVRAEKDRHLFFGLCAFSPNHRIVKEIFLSDKSIISLPSEVPHQPQAKV